MVVSGSAFPHCLLPLDPVRFPPPYASFKQYPPPQTQRSIPASKSLLAALCFALTLFSIPLLRFDLVCLTLKHTYLPLNHHV